VVSRTCPVVKRQLSSLKLEQTGRKLHFAGFIVQDEQVIVVHLLEIEHLRNGIGNAIKRTVPDALAIQPIVLDESNRGSLVSHSVVHEVVACPR